jgi:hypothetical protein
MIEKIQEQLPVKTLARIMAHTDWCELRVWLEYRYWAKVERKTQVYDEIPGIMQMRPAPGMSAKDELAERQRITNQIINRLDLSQYALPENDAKEVAVSGKLYGLSVAGKIDVLLVPHDPALNYEIIEIKTNQNNSAREQLAIYSMLAKDEKIAEARIANKIRGRSWKARIHSDEADPVDVILDSDLERKIEFAVRKAFNVVHGTKKQQTAKVLGGTCAYCIATSAECYKQAYQ